LDKSQEQTIRLWIRRIERSSLPVARFFVDHEVPFSRSQYYVYKKLLAVRDSLASIAHRCTGGNRKLSPEAEEYVAGCLKKSPRLSLAGLQAAVAERFGCQIGLSGMSRAVERVTGRQNRRPRGRPQKAEEPRRETNPLGGFEVISALAYYLKWPERVTGIIEQRSRTLKRTKRFRSRQTDKDVKGRSPSGQFTQSYTQRPDVRGSRFASVEAKRKTKNWHAMDLMRDSPTTLARKSTAILSLPVITLNGTVRDVNVPLGEALKHLCGYNYKQRSISRYLSELKYLGISRRLLEDLPKFWADCWGDQVEKLAGPVFCYYIDGTTKALWSSQRVKQNKVTMLGRVMGCLEHVFIHDGFGHPIYFETYSGHAPVGEHILGLFEKIEASRLDLPRSAPRVYRAIVMDARQQQCPDTPRVCRAADLSLCDAPR
jgi:transposase